MANNFATLVWEGTAGANPAVTLLNVLSAVGTAGITVLDTPLITSAAGHDTNMAVFRYVDGPQLSRAVGNVRALGISFVLTTSQVGNTKAQSADVNRSRLETVTG
jgi:hypothetical protein